MQNSEHSTTGISCVKVIIIGICIPIIFFLVLKGVGCYQAWMYMRPYKDMVIRNATKEEVIMSEGMPIETISNSQKLKIKTQNKEPIKSLPPLRGGYVFVYPADPYNDGEGYVLYLVFDQSDKLVHATLGL